MIRAGLDLVLSTGLAEVPAAELLTVLAEAERCRRVLEGAVDQKLVAEVIERGLDGDYAYTGPADLLVQTLRVTPAEARARVLRARNLGPRRALTGEPLPSLLPEVEAAVSAGEISSAHVAVITKCIESIPAAIASTARPVAEALLVEAARYEHPGLLARTAQALLARLDPDGTEPRDRDVERRRDVSLHDAGDGSGILTGRLTPELKAALHAVVDTLSAPVPAEDGVPDDRTPGQRRHDAMLEAMLRLLRSGTLPSAGGMPVTILVTTTVEDLDDPDALAVTSHGDAISVRRLLGIAGDAELQGVIVNQTGGVLALGRAQRLATCAQRRALAARDGGCAFPGCDRPASWCEAHHVVDWVSGGSTDVDNLVLLCRFHHREFGRRGWTIRMARGRPEFLPPPWIDPERRWRRNTVHHLPDLRFPDPRAA